jgi:hypothetical protein
VEFTSSIAGSQQTLLNPGNQGRTAKVLTYEANQIMEICESNDYECVQRNHDKKWVVQHKNEKVRDKQQEDIRVETFYVSDAVDNFSVENLNNYFEMGKNIKTLLQEQRRL